jgi:hypothetical protein
MTDFGEDFFDDPFADDGPASIDEFHGFGSQDSTGLASGSIEPTPSSFSVSNAAPVATSDDAQPANGPAAGTRGKNLEKMMETVLAAMLGTQEMFKATMENRQTRS